MVQIKDISPYNEDYSELEAIGDAIGDAKIVMLGEQGHGDAPTFLAKSKIIKYLHEEKGFNVVAFEADFFGLNAGWDSLYKTDAAIDSFVRGNILPLWTACDACQEFLFEYLPGTFQTDHPLQLSGFDSQLYLNYSVDSLSSKLDSVFRYYDLPVTRTPEYTAVILPYIDSTTLWYQPFIDTNQFAKSHEYYTQIRQELLTKLSKDSFWVLIMDNLIAANTQFSIYSTKGKTVPYYEVRDKQMADNIAWLSRVKYPDEKIIIWAHNFHISKQNLDTNESSYGKTSMGGFMSRDSALIAQTYVLGFTSYSGSYGTIWGPLFSTRHKKKSFESWVDDSYFYGFLDFTPYPGNHSEEFWMKGETHYHFKEAWMQKYDGYFYIRTMYPCMMMKLWY